MTLETTEPQATRPICFTPRAFLLGAVLCSLFAWHTSRMENSSGPILAATQIPVMPYMLVVVVVLLLNPLLRFTRLLRPLANGELMGVFVMCMVSAGIASYGWAGHILGIVSGLSNEHWNNEQSRWSIYVEPVLKDSLFVSAEGAQASAQRLQSVSFALKDARDVFRAARDVERSRKQKADLSLMLDALTSAPAEEQEQKRPVLQRQLRVAEHAYAYATKAWSEKFAGKYVQTDVLSGGQARIDELTAREEVLRKEHDLLRKTAFEEIRIFRRGLPKEMRAIPGVLYVPGEGLGGYAQRIRRMSAGRHSLQLLLRVRDKLRNGELSTAGAVPFLHQAADVIKPVAAMPELEATRTALDTELQRSRTARSNAENSLRDLRNDRRFAPVRRFPELDAKIAETAKQIKTLSEEIKNLEEELAIGIAPHLTATSHAAATRTRLLNVIQEIAQQNLTASALADRLTSVAKDYPLFDASLHRFFLGDTRWQLFLRPLLIWGLVVLLTYIVLFSFNVLIFRQWAHHEKLIYPLVQLPLLLVDNPDPDKHGIPPMFKRGLFWVGFTVAFGILSWNYLATAKIIPDVRPVPLNIPFQDYLRGSFLDAIHTAQLNFIFTLIGLAFLIPARISFSMWFFFVFYLVQVIILCALGYGTNARSFPQDSRLLLSFATAQGGGGMMIFALVVLWKCRQYLFCCIRPGALRGLDADECHELRISSISFLAASLGLLLAFVFLLGANPYYSIFFYIVSLMVTIGLTRAVAEGGVFSLQSDFTPMQIIRHTVGMDKTWTNASFFAPLWVLHALFWFDLKSFIAPAMANSLKIKEHFGMRRLRFHVAVWLAILLALTVSVASNLILCYYRGADSMRNWNFGSFAKDLTFNTIKEMIANQPVDTCGAGWWMLAGAVTMAFILFSRRKLFWMVHPIGLIMLINPLMRGYWASILVGWLCKTLVTRYGNKDSYDRIRSFFVGLMVGELTACILSWTSLDGWWGL